MTLTLTSREFNQDTARAKREAARGPVFVTDRGKPTHVLLTVQEFERLKGPKRSLFDLLYVPGLEGVEDLELELPRRAIEPEEEIDWGEV